MLRAGRSAMVSASVYGVSETARKCNRIERSVRLCVSRWLSVLRGLHEKIVVGDLVLRCITA